jgi:hypothetical protein
VIPEFGITHTIATKDQMTSRFSNQLPAENFGLASGIGH